MKGHDPADHEVTPELERIRKYYAKIKAVEQPETRKSATSDRVGSLSCHRLWFVTVCCWSSATHNAPRTAHHASRTPSRPLIEEVQNPLPAADVFGQFLAARRNIQATLLYPSYILSPVLTSRFTLITLSFSGTLLSHAVSQSPASYRPDQPLRHRTSDTAHPIRHINYRRPRRPANHKALTPLPEIQHRRNRSRAIILCSHLRAPAGRASCRRATSRQGRGDA
jgi:hypothetical protein